MRRMSPKLLHWLTRWLVGAMLLATLAPGISRSLASTRGAGDWVEVCSGTGIRWVQMGAAVDGVETDDLTRSALTLDNCGHCLLSADRFAPLIPSLPVFLAAASLWPTPPYRGLTPIVASAPSPGARGPPLLS